MKRETKVHCRVCLQCDLDIDGAGGVSSIFDKSNKCFIYEKLNRIAEVNIQPDDGLPDKICAECLLELENAINFKLKCETSNSILQSAASARHGLKGEEAPEEDVKEEPDEYTEHEYLDEELESLLEVPLKPDNTNDQEYSPSSPELTLKLDEYEEREQPLSLSKLHFDTLSKPSKAVNLQLECHDCGAHFKSKCKLKVHWFKAHLTCNICPRKFRSFKELNKHKAKKLSYCIIFKDVNVIGEGKAKQLHCKHCDYSTTRTSYIVKHMVTHTREKRYACNLCPERYQNFNGLQCHMEYKHHIFKKSKECNICGKIIQGMYKYAIHKKKHKTKVSVPCEVCKKMIGKWNLDSHMRTHSTDRPFTCDVCAASFKTMVALGAHKRYVHDRKIHKYKCSICEYTCRNHGAMKNHQQKHLEKNIACAECGKFFDNEVQLTLHKEKHSKRNHPCPQCDLTFYTRPVMLRHINMIHKIYMA